MTLFTSRILRFSGNPRRRGNCGGVPERGSPYVELISPRMSVPSFASDTIQEDCHVAGRDM